VHAESSTPSFVVSGVVLEQGNNTLLNQFTQWLAKKSSYPLNIQFTNSYQDLSQNLHNHPQNLAWTCGVPFVEDHVTDQQQLVAVPLFHGQPTYRSFVITTRGRSEKKLIDFKGQVFAYSDPRSNSGFIAPAYALKQQGIDIQTHFRFLMHTGLHEYSIEALLAGQADVANIDEYVVVEYFKAHPKAKKQLIILEKFGPFPFTPIVAGKKVTHQDVVRLQHTLTTMHQDPEGLRMLNLLGIDGFIVKPASFYQPILQMLEQLKP